MKIAVIGGGIAGISAAYHLQRQGASTTLFEAGPRLGGDVDRVIVHAWDGTPVPVDHGVTDFNAATFVEFDRFLRELGADVRPILRETAFFTEGRKPLYFITDRGQITFWRTFENAARFQSEIDRFKREAREVMDDPARFAETSVGRYLSDRDYSGEFRDLFLIPRASAAFLMHRDPIADFPIVNLIRFMTMHSMVGPHPSGRSTVAGGMHGYLKLAEARLRALGTELRLDCAIRRITRQDIGGRVSVVRDAAAESFDQVVIATKPDQALALLSNPTHAEASVLGQVPYQRDRLVTHTDLEPLPRTRRMWGAFNVVAREKTPYNFPSITFWPTRMHGLSPRAPLVFSTLNPITEPAAELIVAEKTLCHPIATWGVAENLRRLRALQGADRIWFAGSYVEMPFLHENAFNSGRAAAEGILRGLELPAARPARRLA